MNKIMKIPRSQPSEVFSFLEVVQRLDTCTIEQIRSELRAQWPPVRSAKTFLEYFELVNVNDKKISLSDISKRMLKYSGNKRIDFLISHVRLHEKEPFAYLIKILQSCGEIKRNQLASSLNNKFEPNKRWTVEEIKSVNECYEKWLEILRLIKIENNLISWIGGTISITDITHLAKLTFLQDRSLYDKLTEKYQTPKNMLDQPHSLISEISLEKDDNKRGDLFELYIAACFDLLGFSYRSKAGSREKGITLSYQSSKGGGDISLFSHFPVNTNTNEYHGCALACEAKSTEGQVGSKAVGQARNLQVKIVEHYLNYLVFPLVVSRTKYGYDASGKDLAPPEVVLFTQEILLELCKLQKERLEKSQSLILPVHILKVIELLIEMEKIEPSTSDVLTLIQQILQS